MNLKNLIRQERICLLEDTRKSEVLIHMSELACSTSDEITDLEALKKDIFFREELMSTGIGLGLGVPHLRMEGLSEPVVCIGVQKKGIYDYQSLDEVPVKVVLMILVGKEQHRQYIRILSQLTGMIKNRDLIPQIAEAESAEAVYRILVED